jgi:CBS domain-containing protein
MQVREFMTSILVTSDASTRVSEAAKLMAAEDIGSLVITKGDTMVGIVTRRDLISSQLLSPEAYEDLTVEDIMTSHVVSVSPEADLWQAISLMDKTGKKHIPVVADDQTIGIITATDLIRVLATMKLIAGGASDD